MEREGDVMLELCDVALTTSVHADALECAIDDARNTLAHMQNEENTLREWEEKLRELIEHKKRIDALRSLVHRAKSERENSLHSIQFLQQQQQQQQKEQQEKQTIIKPKKVTSKNIFSNNNSSNRNSRYSQHTKIAGRLQENLSYNNHHIPQSHSPSLASLETQEGTLSVDAKGRGAIEDQIIELQRQISTLHANSIKARLLKLEEAKRRVQESHAAERVAALIDQFTFPACVQEMWSHCDSTNNYSNNNNVITKHNVDNFLIKAATRYANRYADELHALSQANLTTQCDWREVMECLLYAQELDADKVDRAHDMETVEYLQREHSITQKDESQMSSHICNSFNHIDNYNLGCEWECERKCLHTCEPSLTSSVKNNCSECTQTPLLSRFDFCALPPSWPEVEELTHIPEHNVLPPARHILTKRFSFANVDEFMALQHLRVQIQRMAIQRIFNKLPKMVPTYMSHCTSRERAAASLRLTALAHSLAKECESILNEHDICCNTQKEQRSNKHEENLTSSTKSIARHVRPNAWLTLISTDTT